MKGTKYLPQTQTLQSRYLTSLNLKYYTQNSCTLESELNRPLLQCPAPYANCTEIQQGLIKFAWPLWQAQLAGANRVTRSDFRLHLVKFTLTEETKFCRINGLRPRVAEIENLKILLCDTFLFRKFIGLTKNLVQSVQQFLASKQTNRHNMFTNIYNELVCIFSTQ